MTSTYRTCKRWEPPCPFCTHTAPHPSPTESDWPNEDQDGDKERTREAKRKEQEQEKKEQENISNDYHPTSPVYDHTFKQDPLPYYTPKKKLALDPDYYHQDYDPNEDREDTPLLVNNLVSPPEKVQQKGGEGQ